MSPVEFIEMIFMASSVVGEHSMNLVAILFAYIVAGHFAGPQLTRTQFVVLTILYSAMAFGIAQYAVRSETELTQLYQEFIRAHPDEASRFSPFYPLSRPSGLLQPLLFCFGWAISVWYVWSHRRTAA